MSEKSERIARNLDQVRGRIAAAAQRAGRAPDDVRLVAVTKTVGVDEARILCDLGVTDLGENRPELARDKIEAIDRPARWHMIGAAQRRKAKVVVELFDCVDAVDRVALAEALERRCQEHDKHLPVLIEVNVAGEEGKHGFTHDEVESAIEAIGRLEHLHVEGLMTMAPFVDDPEVLRPVFARLRELGERLGLEELSMGMTNDFEIAVEEGATQVRIGTALYV